MSICLTNALILAFVLSVVNKRKMVKFIVSLLIK
jgi:hypothetical protein